MNWTARALAVGILILAQPGGGAAAASDSPEIAGRLWVAASPHSMQGCGFKLRGAPRTPLAAPLVRISGGRRTRAAARHPLVVGHRSGFHCAGGRARHTGYVHLRRPELPGGFLSLPLEDLLDP